MEQVFDVVSKYIDEHPEVRHEHSMRLIQRAFKEAWPKENANVVVGKFLSKVQGVEEGRGRHRIVKALERIEKQNQNKELQELHKRLWPEPNPNNADVQKQPAESQPNTPRK